MYLFNWGFYYSRFFLTGSNLLSTLGLFCINLSNYVYGISKHYKNQKREIIVLGCFQGILAHLWPKVSLIKGSKHLLDTCTDESKRNTLRERNF